MVSESEGQRRFGFLGHPKVVERSYNSYTQLSP